MTSNVVLILAILYVIVQITCALIQKHNGKPVRWFDITSLCVILTILTLLIFYRD